MGFQNNNDDDDDDFFWRPQPETQKDWWLLGTERENAPDNDPERRESTYQPRDTRSVAERLEDETAAENQGEQAPRQSDDPCIDPPVQPGGDTTPMEFDPPSETFIFPRVDDSERAASISGVYLDNALLQRKNLFIPQQYYYDVERRIPQDALYVPRWQNHAYSSVENMNSRAPQILIDPFRYASGLVYEHLNSEIINLPSGGTASVVQGSPKYIGKRLPGPGNAYTYINRSSATGIPYRLRLGSDDNPNPFRVQAGFGSSLASDLVLMFRPSYLTTEAYEAMPPTLQRTFEQIESGNLNAAAAFFSQDYLIGGANDSTLINKDRSDNSDDLRATGVPFEDHTFIAPASFYKGEISDSFAEPIDISSVNTFYYENEESQLAQGSEQRAALAGFQEYSIPSLYRRYAVEYGIRSTNNNGRRIQLNIEKLICPENDVVQKFPAQKVGEIMEINRLFFSDDHLNTPSENIWIQRNLGPYNRVNFNMQDSPIANMLEESRVDTIILEMLESKSHYNPTYYTQILDQTISYGPAVGIEDLNIEDFPELFRDTVFFQDRVDELGLGNMLNDRVSINLRPNEYHDPVIDLNRFINQSPAGPRELYDFIVNEDEYPLSFYGSEKMEIDPTGVELQRKLRSLYRSFETQGNLESFILDRERSYHEIFKSEPSYSEVIAYRVEKIDTATKEIIQNFYFFNSSEVQNFSFIDKQVISGQKYTYKIYCLNFVIGCNYQYFPRVLSTTLRAGETKYALRAETTRNVRIIETPFFEQEIITAFKKDLPPLPPNAQPYRGGSASENENNNYIFEMSSNTGTLLEEPVIIKAEDVSIITDTLSNQRATGVVNVNSQKIKYKSDTIPSHYEMMMISEPPTSYSDFSSAESVIVESSSPLIEFSLEPNQDRFVIFRAHDEAGISNPTSVYTFKNLDNGDGSFLSFERYEMFDLLDDSITFERNISIEPAFDQALIDFRNVIENLGDELYESAPSSESQGPMNLGIQDPSVWGEEFIFRVTSSYSGRSFDVSVVFTQEDRGESEPVHREQDEYSSDLCENAALEREQERQGNRRDADNYLDRLNRIVIRPQRQNQNPRGPSPEDGVEDPIRELEIDNEEEILGPNIPRPPIPDPDRPQPPSPPPPPRAPGPGPRHGGGGGGGSGY
tara:strand:- start:4513 stop:7950 length:3438 start_codon:yes stop_codon:yes gene_type:complete